MEERRGCDGGGVEEVMALALAVEGVRQPHTVYTSEEGWHLLAS